MVVKEVWNIFSVIRDWRGASSGPRPTKHYEREKNDTFHDKATEVLGEPSTDVVNMRRYIECAFAVEYLYSGYSAFLCNYLGTRRNTRWSHHLQAIVELLLKIQVEVGATVGIINPDTLDPLLEWHSLLRDEVGRREGRIGRVKLLLAVIKYGLYGDGTTEVSDDSRQSLAKDIERIQRNYQGRKYLETKYSR